VGEVKHAYIVMLGMLSYFLATDIYTPSMPEIALFFNETSDEVQRTMSYFLLGTVLTCILTGIFADQYGKKRFLMGGMVVALIGSLLTIFAPSLSWLVFGRFIQGLGGGVATVIGFAAIQELYGEEKHAQIYGQMGIILAGIPAVAPFVGGIISTTLGWHVNFAIMGIMFALSFICIWLYLPDSLNKRIPHSSLQILKSYQSILTSRAFLALALTAPLFCAVEWFYVTYLPFYMQNQIGISAEIYGFYVGVLIVWFAIGSYLGGKLMTAYGVHKTIMGGLSCGIMASLILWITTFKAPLSAFWICAALAVFFLGFGILFPSTISSALNVFKEAKTRASSVRTLFAMAFSFIGSYTAEWVNDSKLSSLAIFVSICSLLAFGIYHMRVRTKG
jgi:DHA1 family bicyclomycin/chloramphenicol resistance-like MFS transporter